MLDVPSSALNGRYDRPLETHDVALAVARKVTGLQRQIVLELRSPPSDAKDAKAEKATDPDGTPTSQQQRANTPALAPTGIIADTAPGADKPRPADSGRDADVAQGAGISGGGNYGRLDILV